MSVRRSELRTAYLKLGTGELAAAVVLCGVATVVVTPRLAGPHDRAALWSALIPLAAVLVQAGGYWLSARTWVEEAPMPAAMARLYRAFRLGNAVLLAAGLAGILAWLPERGGTLFLVLATWAFAVLEYVNYFLVRLAYPPRRWFTAVGQWRTPRLVQDLRASRRQA